MPTTPAYADAAPVTRMWQTLTGTVQQRVHRLIEPAAFRVYGAGGMLLRLPCLLLVLMIIVCGAGRLG